MEPGQLLSEWRKTRRLSQFELAGRASVSSRHLSFVETGRARASAALLRRLAAALDLNCRDTNELLVASRHAPVHGETRLDAPTMAPVREALEVMLHNHLPYPAGVLDAQWNLLLANEALQNLIQAIVAEGGPPPATDNIIELVFHPEGFKPFILNWDAVASALLRRVRRDLDLRPDPLLQRLYRRLEDLADLSALLGPTPVGVEPMLTWQLMIGGRRLSTFSTLASFGTAMDVVIEELRIEHYFPADDVTREFFEAANSSAHRG